MMNKATQIIVGLLLGFDKSHEVFMGVQWDEIDADELLKAQQIAKKDIFSPLPAGKSFFEYESTWKNVEKLFSYLKRSGQPLAPEDFLKPISKGKNLLDMAAECKSLPAAFSTQVWAGHSAEMEQIWYKLDKEKRGETDFTKIRNAVVRAEGGKTREEELQSRGIAPKEIWDAMNAGQIDKVKKALEEKGAHLTVADAMLPDSAGVPALNTWSAWNKFDELHKEWKSHGETPGTEFYLFRRGYNRMMIEGALEHSLHQKVFNATIFAGRPQEMFTIYNALQAKHQEKIDISTLLPKILEETYKERITISDGLTLHDLTEPLHEPLEGRDAPQLTGLGLEKVWNKIDEVKEKLAAHGERITLDNLRSEYGFPGETCLMRAAELKKFDKVLDIIRQNGERLTLEDLLYPSKEGKTLLQILITTSQLEKALDPSLWTGHASDLGKLWEKMPQDKKEGASKAFRDALTTVNRESLRTLGAVTTRTASGPAPG